MLDTYADVERALSRFHDMVRPCGGSIVTVPRGKGPARFPFHRSLLDDLEIRTELKARMACLDERSRYVLLRWYIEGATADVIARHLRCSARHVHRLRTSAVEALVNLGHYDEFADADVAEFG
jgi:DNA-directed RNA polymerase specialized sigma24 family protein